MSSHKWIFVWPVWSSITHSSLTRPGFHFLFVTSFICYFIVIVPLTLTLWFLVDELTWLTEIWIALRCGRLELLYKLVDGCVLSKWISPELGSLDSIWVVVNKYLYVVPFICIYYSNWWTSVLERKCLLMIEANYFFKFRTGCLKVKGKIVIPDFAFFIGNSLWI